MTNPRNKRKRLSLVKVATAVGLVLTGLAVLLGALYGF